VTVLAGDTRQWPPGLDAADQRPHVCRHRPQAGVTSAPELMLELNGFALAASDQEFESITLATAW